MGETIHGDQERVDLFYELVRSGRWDALIGQSAEGIHTRFGDPDDIWVLDHNGHRWTRISCRFSASPSQATEEEREAIAKGMQFSPTLFLRDGISVHPSQFEEEVLRGAVTSGPPKGIDWKHEGTFP
jgi:hypothetical protein